MCHYLEEGCQEFEGCLLFNFINLTKGENYFEGLERASEFVKFDWPLFDFFCEIGGSLRFHTFSLRGIQHFISVLREMLCEISNTLAQEK